MELTTPNLLGNRGKQGEEKKNLTKLDRKEPPSILFHLFPKTKKRHLCVISGNELPSPLSNVELESGNTNNKTDPPQKSFYS